MRWPRRQCPILGAVCALLLHVRFGLRAVDKVRAQSSQNGGASGADVVGVRPACACDTVSDRPMARDDASGSSGKKDQDGNRARPESLPAPSPAPIAADSPAALAPTWADPGVAAVAATLSPEQAALAPPISPADVRVTVSAVEPQQPTRIGRYLVLRKLGQGGMGVVYSAYDPELDRKVAIKLLRPHHEGSAGQARMRREAQAMAQVSHSHIVQVYEVGQDEHLGHGGLFVAMEFVAGKPLSAWQTQQRSGRQHLPAADLRALLRLYVQAGHGLLAAHAAGLIHRDFKPDNVLVGDDGRVRVADFGLARSLGGAAAVATSGSASVLDSSAVVSSAAGARSDQADPSLASAASTNTGQRLTQVGAIMGTPGYMSPEQVRGQEATAQSDQFSFCAALHEALYGQLPFSGDTFDDFVLAILANQRRPRSGFPHEVPVVVAQAIERGLSLDASDRFASMADLLSQLEQGLEAESETPRSRRNSILTGLGVGSATLAAIAAGTAQHLTRPQGDESLNALLLPSIGLTICVLVVGWLVHRRDRLRRSVRQFYFMIAVCSVYITVSRLVAYAAQTPRSRHLPQELLGMVALAALSSYLISRRLWVITLPMMCILPLMALGPAAVDLVASVGYPLASFGMLYIAVTEKHRAPGDADPGGLAASSQGRSPVSRTSSSSSGADR